MINPRVTTMFKTASYRICHVIAASYLFFTWILNFINKYTQGIWNIKQYITDKVLYMVVTFRNMLIHL